MHTTRAKGLLAVTLEDKQMLRAAYMPFLVNGGLFIPSGANGPNSEDLAFGDEVFVLLRLAKLARQAESRARDENLPVAGKVAWITPRGAGGRPAGIGVQFSDGETKALIEGLLADCESAWEDQDTFTL